MKSLRLTIQYLILATMLVNCAFGDGDPEEIPGGGNEAINGEDELDENNIADENLEDEENFENEEGLNDQESQNFNSDTNNEFVQQEIDNQGFGNNENLLNQQDAANFQDGGEEPLNFQQNQGQQFQNQGQQEFQEIDEGEAMNNATEDNDFLQNNQQTDFEQAAVDNSVNETVDESAAPMEPTGDGRVKYVVSSSQLYDKPDGSSVGNLEKGDHPLVFGDGEWSRTSDGYYVPSRDLTSSPVGRTRSRSVWMN